MKVEFETLLDDDNNFTASVSAGRDCSAVGHREHGRNPRGHEEEERGGSGNSHPQGLSRSWILCPFFSDLNVLDSPQLLVVCDDDTVCVCSVKSVESHSQCPDS